MHWLSPQLPRSDKPDGNVDRRPLLPHTRFMGELAAIKDSFAFARMREIGFGFVYWLAFLLVLEPDNVVRIVHSGSS